MTHHINTTLLSIHPTPTPLEAVYWGEEGGQIVLWTDPVVAIGLYREETHRGDRVGVDCSSEPSCEVVEAYTATRPLTLDEHMDSGEVYYSACEDSNFLGVRVADKGQADRDVAWLERATAAKHGAAG